MADGPVKLNAKQIVRDIRSGLDDTALMQKYGLSSSQIDKLFDKLINMNLIEASEIKKRAVEPSSKDTPGKISDSTVSYRSDTDRCGTAGLAAGRKILYFCFLAFLWGIACFVVLIPVNVVLEITAGFKIPDLGVSMIALVLATIMAFYGAVLRVDKP